MKTLKSKLLLGFCGIIIISSALVLSSCTDKFTELNTDKTKLTTLTKTEYPFLFSKGQSSSTYPFYRYQVAQNLFADLYCGYFATTATYFPSDRNVIRMDWVGASFEPYTSGIPQLKTILDETDKGSTENALASVMWVYIFHRITDYFGPIPYFKAGIPANSVPYDAQDKIYDDFFKRLTAAAAIIKSKSTEKPYGNFDLMYKGDMTKWLKFTNSLRLRLALRISKVDPARAKAEAEAAVAGGVLESNADDAFMIKAQAGDDFNGLSSISVWNEFRMSANMESVLKGYNDPRIGVYFQPASATKTYDGLRNALSPAQLALPGNSNDENSNIGEKWSKGSGSSWQGQQSALQDILHSSEVYLLRAEGALNGWNMGGTAKALYEKGIENSMRQAGVSDGAAITAYLNSDKTPIAPNDQQKSPAMSNIPVKFGSAEAVQREQIGTQKWLAIYPDGFEAWAEYRRSGFPKLYPTVNNENADLKDGTRPRRIPFLDNEKQSNGEAVKAAAALLGGPDKVSTPLWWDKN